MSESYAPSELLAEARRLWDHWATHLGLSHWWINVAFMEPGGPGADDDAGMTVTWHPQQYHRAYLKLHPDQSAAVFPLSLRILHEVCHIKYSNIADFAARTAPTYTSSWDEVLETESDNTASIIWRLHAQTDCKL